MKTALLIYPHQLFKVEHLPDVDTVVMVEDPLFFGRDHQFPLNIHKQKIILHRASMRRYIEEVLWPNDFDVQHIELDVFMESGDVLDALNKFEHVYVFDPVDDVLTKRLLQARRDREGTISLEFLDNPNFYLKDGEVREYLQKTTKHVFSDFYQWQRERFNILIDENYKPEGGKWSFDAENRQKLPQGEQLPSFQAYGDNKHVTEAIEYVNNHFPDNPGSTDFIYPTNHQEAESWLADFVKHRIDHFGTYQDAMDKDVVWAYHSVLSSSLNIGLLHAQQVVDAVLARHDKKAIDIASLEGFIRQVLGWREYVRGQYLVNGSKMRTSNEFGHRRQLTEAWYSGSLGIPPYDNMVQRLHGHGYAHHIERLMVAGNLMMLCEIRPEDVYAWFNELFIDAYDWVMVPNVYAMSQFTSDGDMTTKPNISSSNYIMNMSSYEKGEWNDIWDGLYWRFIEKHQAAFSKNPRMKMMVTQLEALNPDRKRIIGYHAEDFLKQFTKL